MEHTEEKTIPNTQNSSSSRLYSEYTRHGRVSCEALGVLFAQDDRARMQGTVLWAVQDGLIFLEGPEVLLKVAQLLLAQGQVFEIYFF